MPLLRWGGALAKRASLFLLAGVAVVFLLYAQSGISPAGPDAKPSFDQRTWVTSSVRYLTQVSSGDLGTLRKLRATGYLQDQPVAHILRAQVPRSLSLVAVSLVISLGIGTALGLMASRFGPRWSRGGLLFGTLLLLSTPEIMLVFLLRRVVQGFGPLSTESVLAPALALSALPIALVARVAAVAFDEVYDQAYIRTATGKGLAAHRVVLVHALKNAWIRVSEAGLLIAGSLITGLVIVEYSFYFAGLGRTLGLIIEAGGQPEATASIVLVLLVGVLILDLLFGSIRMALDPRLEGNALSGWAVSRWSLAALVDGLHDLVATLTAIPAAVGSWASDLPERLRRIAWDWRPSRLLRELWSNPVLLIGLVGMAGLFFVAVFGGQLQDLRAMQTTPKFIVHNDKAYFPPFPPGLPGLPLGTDLAGRDLLGRILVGARYTLFFTLAVTPVRFLIAVPWGLLAGFRGGIWKAGSGTLSLILTALPVILVPASLLPLLRLINGAGSDTSFWAITLILAVAGIPRLAQQIRLQVEATLVQPFVEGARSLGAGTGRILIRHVLPHLSPQLWVSAAADMAWTMILLAQLGVFSIYVGGAAITESARSISVLPRLPDWSSMLSKPYEVVYRAPWALWVPALAFLIAIVSFNLVAEGLRRRSQHIVRVGAGVMEDKASTGQSRLGLEWAAAAMVLVTAVGVAATYGFREQPVVSSAALGQQSPMQHAVSEMQIVLDTIYGTGENAEKASAGAKVRSVVTLYLEEARKAGLNQAQIQQDTRGRVNIFSIDPTIQLIQFQVPGVIAGSHLFFQNVQSGVLSYFNGSEKPVSVAPLRTDGVLRGAIMTGTVPGPDNWIISTWVVGGGWRRDSTWIEQIYQLIPEGYRAELVTQRRGSERVPTVIEMTGGPFNSARVGPNGDIEVCKERYGPCVTISWQETGY